MNHKIASGNVGVIISANDDNGPFSCRMWVNVRDSFEHADATLTATKRSSMKGAIKWAEQKIAEHNSTATTCALGFGAVRKCPNMCKGTCGYEAARERVALPPIGPMARR